MLLINPYRFAAPFDPAAAQQAADDYIDAVEAADGQSLEAGVVTALEDFIIGLHQDNIWPALKASCILAGARTLAGALVPLVGTAPTNFNFVSADYNRKSGLKGNGSTKYLNSNRNNNADPQNDHHASVFYSEPEVFVTGGKFTMGVGAATLGAFNIGRRGVSLGNLFFRNRNSTVNDAGVLADVSNTLCATSRSGSTGYDFRYNSASGAFTQTSQTPQNGNVFVFASNNSPSLNSLARLSFYSIGESLDLAALDTRVTTLMTDLAAAI